MDSTAAAAAPNPTPAQRTFLTLTSPSRAFAGPGLGRSWWLPYLLLLLASLAFFATVGARVGWPTVTRNNLAASPKQQARIDQLPPSQQSAQIAVVARITRITAYVSSAVGPLIFGAVVAAVLLATLNFALRGHARFPPLFALYFFSTLPAVLKLLLVVALLLAGVDTDSFLINNPLGSNPAFYLLGSGTPRWALSLLSWLDLFTLWQLAILTFGCAAIAAIPRARAAVAVFGWTILLALIGTAFTFLA